MNERMSADFFVPPTPPGVNPYVGPGLAGVPAKLFRVMQTPQKLSRFVRETLFYRGRDRAWLASESGLPPDVVDEIADEGTGCISDVRRVLDCLGIVPIELPAPPAIRAER